MPKGAINGPHTMSGAPCHACGDMDGCWWPTRFRRARAFAEKKHGNQMYGREPYIYHLANVVEVLQDFEAEPAIQVAGWLHDVVEDCDVSPLEIVELLGEPLSMGLRVANLVWAVTNQDRKPRYDRILKVHGAVQLKLADRIANVEYSKLTDNLLKFEHYVNQHGNFRQLQEEPGHDVMWKRLEEALTCSSQPSSSSS